MVVIGFFFIEYLYKDSAVVILLFLFLMAAITKRAQIPFSAWLPAAMAAPTPVSSLVHSSTLVTAGVYILIRLSSIMGVSFILFVLSLITLFMSSISALYEYDLKKIVALSTLSQLGLILFSLSLGFYELTFFHLLTHAIFKSLLFLCSGNYIHSIGSFQDVRFLGLFSGRDPVISFFFIGSSLSLMGWPFLSGFYSKDLIFELLYIRWFNMFTLLLLGCSLVITVLYNLRLFFHIFIKKNLVMVLLIRIDQFEVYLSVIVLFFSSLFLGSLIYCIYFPLIFIFIPYLIKILIFIVIIRFIYYIYIYYVFFFIERMYLLYFFL